MPRVSTVSTGRAAVRLGGELREGERARNRELEFFEGFLGVRREFNFNDWMMDRTQRRIAARKEMAGSGRSEGLFREIQFEDAEERELVMLANTREYARLRDAMQRYDSLVEASQKMKEATLRLVFEQKIASFAAGKEKPLVGLVVRRQQGVWQLKGAYGNTMILRLLDAVARVYSNRADSLQAARRE